MRRLWDKSCDIAAARRGQIIQRILVDGWTATQAAAAFSVSERQIARWVAAYRRYGMASLRDGAAADPRQSWLARLWLILTRRLVGVGPRFRRPEPAPCVALHRHGEDIRHQG